MFTSYLEKSFIYFQERPWVMGYVSNCDAGIDIYKKDFVHIRILDINGDVVDDNWQPDRKTARSEFDNPTKYIFNQMVFREGSFTGHVNQEGEKNHYLRDNEYYFYMPQIHEIDFRHMGVYQIELKYGNYTNIIWFAVLDPYCWVKNIIEPNSCRTIHDQ